MTTVSEANARGPLVNIASWITLVSAILAAGVKLYTKMSITKKVQLDDALLLVAVLAAVGCCIAQAKQVQFGLGQHEDSLTSGQISSYYLSYYVTQIFYVVTVYVAKLVGLYFFISLTGENVKRKIVRCLMVFIGAWTTAAIFVVAFQCELPRPWKNPSSQKCVNKLAFWTVNGVVDILTQLCVGLLPVYLLAGLQLRKTKKIFSMLSFTPNMLTLPLVILRLIYLYNLSHTATDTTWRSFSLALVTVLHADISIVAACIPFFKPIVDSLSVGMIANDLHFSLESNESLSPTPNHPHSGGGILSRGTIFSSLSKGPEKGSKGSGSGKSSMPSGGSKSQVSYPTVREGWELREGLKKSSNSRS